MTDGERLGASFSIDITALKSGLQQANRLIKESNSEFKAAAAGLDDWTKSEEGLTAKLKNLNDVADLQAKKVNALQEEYDRCVENGLDPMSAAAVKMRTDINNEKAALEKTKSEIHKYKTALNELENASEDAGDELEDLADSAENSGDGFTIAKGAIADLISNGIQNLAGACKSAIGSIYGLAESTKESRVAFAKLEASFDSAGLGAEAAEKTMTDLYGVLGDTDKATEASNLIAKMSKNQEDLDKNTRILTGVYAEYGDSIPTEGLAEAMSATAAMSSVQGVLADALEWQGVNLDSYNEKLASFATEEERAAYIQETLTELYGESADAYRENNKALIEANEAQLDYDKTMNKFGNMVEPITTKVRQGFNKILENVLELVEGVDIEAFGEKIDSAFDTFINDILPKIIEGLTWIKDNKDILIAGIAGIGAAFAAFKVVTLIQSVTSALQGMSVAQAALNLVMSLNPIGLVIAAIAGLVTAFVILWKKCDAFREFWLKLWEAIKKACVDAWTGIKNVWDKAVAFFSNVWQGIQKVFSNVATWFGKIFSNAWENIKKAFSTVGSFFGQLWTTITGKFSTIGTNIAEAISGAFKTAMNSVIGTIERAINRAIRLINGAIDLINLLPSVNIGKVAEISLPRLAKGGVVNRATTALIGEDGAEAVVPLEKNTEWIDKVADKLASKSNVVINQTNNYSQAHSRYELYKSKQQTAAAVRLALQGV